MNHEAYIQRCLHLAEQGKGHVSPNPMVGAVLVHNDRIIGEGWHQEYGKAHAEVNCLASVQEADKPLIKDSTMYVSLEPCAHHGNTPPCALRLVHEQVKEVVICNTDPYEQVSGRGIGILINNGIRVETGILEAAGRWVNRRFFCFHEQKRPYIILKWAQTQDGFMAPEDKHRMQISNDESNQLVHKWRTEEDAIMVGYNTAMHDNPQLTARLWEGKNPLRIVTDRKLQLDKTQHLFDEAAETWILNDETHDTSGHTHYIQLNFAHDILPQLMEKLHLANKQSLIVEGGPTLLAAFIRDGLWDEARILTGNKTLGKGVPSPQLTHAQYAFQQKIGNDVLDVYTYKDTHYPYVNGYAL